MKNKLLMAFALLAIAGCNDKPGSSYAAPQASETKACLPVSSDSMLAYDSAALGKADFCLPANQILQEMIISDSKNWATSYVNGDTKANRIAFAISGPDAAMATVMIKTDKQTFRFALKPAASK